ncbi:MAG: hypothetical protein JSU87_09330 [Gemmatimonadota bacterium]|nr:MAG: hypothetical protein JSU87_09330 [Gemmatimonadota bacterium]
MQSDSSRVFVAACALLLLATRGLGDPVGLGQDSRHLLRLSDRVGQTSRYRLAFDIEMRADYAGPPQRDAGVRQLLETLAEGMVLRTALDFEQRLKSVGADGTRTFDVRWHDYAFRGDVGGRPIPPPPGHLDATRELLSRSAEIRTTATGQTLAVDFDHPRLAELAERIERIEGAMPTYLPEVPVAVGDSWTSVAHFPVELTPGGLGSLDLRLEHTLVELRTGVGGPVAVIELRGSYSRLQGLEEGGAGIPIHLQAAMTGRTRFDVAAGRFVDGHYEIDMFALHAADGIEIQLTGHANGTLELVSER